LEFRNVDFFQRKENQQTCRKTLEARKRINNKLNSHMKASLRIAPEITLERGVFFRYATHASME
jgi:hypothetical protein